MRLHTTSKYAIRILSYMANGDSSSLFHAKHISEELDISYKFLSKIMNELVKAEFIISLRGRDGGYKLAKDASSISIMEIVNLFNDFNHKEECLLGIGKCDGANPCATHAKWVRPKSLLEEMFESTTLQNLEGDGFKI